MARHWILVPGIEVRILVAQLNEIEQRLDGSNPPATGVAVAQWIERCSIKIRKARDF